MQNPRPRKPRFQRVSPPPAVQLTDRDFMVLDLISRHRFLRSDHLTTLVPGSTQHLVRRLGRLYHAGIVERPQHQLRLAERPGSIVYCLTEQGRKDLQIHGSQVFPSVPRPRSTASALLLDHDLRVSDVLVAIRAACKRMSFEFQLHHEWPGSSGDKDAEELHPLRWTIRVQEGDGRQPIRVIPDGAFSIHDGDQGQASFLIEVDRGTMPVTRSDPAQTSFVRKIHAYRETRQAGVLWKRWNVPGFRVLVVTESRQRMNSLQRATAKCFRHGRSTMFLFAVAGDLIQAENPFDGPWQNCMGDPAILIQQQPTDSDSSQALSLPLVIQCGLWKPPQPMLYGLFQLETTNLTVLSMQTNQSTTTTFVDFRKVKSAVNILQVLERYDLMDSFKQSGDRLSGPCPIHNGTNPTSFRVSISKNCFNCFGSCGRGGNVIDFVALKEDIPFREAALLLQEWFMGAPPATSSHAPSALRVQEEKPTSPKPRDQEFTPTNDDEGAAENPPLSFELKSLKSDHPYLAERNLEPETVEHFGLGYCSRGVLRGHIAIPIHNAKGELVAYAGRWPGEPPEGQPKYKLPKGFRKSLEVFNLHRALQEPDELPLVVVEGFFDCFALWQAGITKCVALMGCSLSDEQEQLLSDALPNGGTIELLLDNDEAGHHGTEEVASRLLNFALVRSISLPDEVQQPDQLSADELAQLFE